MRILALASRNLKETYRDPLALAFLLAFPLLMMLVFGLAFSGGDAPVFSIGVIDNDQTQVSQAFVSEALASAPTFEVSTYDDSATALKDLKFGDLSAYIIIPPGFGQQVAQNWQGNEADITLNITYDESDLIVSGQIISTVDTIARSFARIEIPVTINATPIYIEEELTYIDFLGPGIIVFGILILIPTAARVITDDKGKGMLTRLLTTPARPLDFILGYSLSLVMIAAAQIAIIMVATWLFGLNMIGNPFFAYLIFLLTSLCCIGMGMIVGSLAKSESQAGSLSWIFAMPMAAISGVWFPIEMMAPFLKA